MADADLALPGIGSSHGFYRGRVGLAALLRCLDLPPGSPVAIQAFTCRAVPDALQVSGYVPVYVDIEADGVNMDPAALATSVTDDVRVVVAQHTYGVPARIDEIAAFCRASGRHLVEDCCHSITGTVGGQRVGTFGVGGFTSFEWGKEIIAGVGGAGWANDEEVQRRLAREWTHLDPPSQLAAARQAAQYAAFRTLYRPETYWFLKGAFASLGRLGAIEANAVPEGSEEVDTSDYGKRLHPTAVRRVQRALRRLGDSSGRRAAVCSAYRREVVNPRLRHISGPEDRQGGWVRYPLRVPDKESLLGNARRRRVELADWYASPVDPLVGADARIVGYEPGSCPRAERLAGEVVTLPTLTSPSSAHHRRAVDLLNSWAG